MVTKQVLTCTEDRKSKTNVARLSFRPSSVKNKAVKNIENNVLSPP